MCTTALGLGPLVAKSNTLLSALLISMAFTTILLFSSITMSVLRNLVPQRLRLLFILMTSSVLVTVLDLILQAYIYDLRTVLDIYIPLLAMNSLVLMLLEKESLTAPVNTVAARAVTMAIMPVTVCLLTGTIRELLVHGAVLTDVAMINPEISMTIATSYLALPLFDTVAGAFIVAGCLLAMANYVGFTKSAPLPPH